MAKKGSRVKIGLVCQVCKHHNYVTEKNRITTTDKLSLNKYCKNCRKKTLHKEKKKLH